ncbi:MAG: VTT domain-containing protein [Syntrophomonadaceae bacterium]|nr:VTT domain-containing protein [Syntrophomonadaceae bacterium]
MSVINFSQLDTVIIYIKSFGYYSETALFILFFIQAIVPFIPYLILAGAAGMIFGKIEGTVLAFVGAMAGALFLFFVIRFFIGSRFTDHVKNRYAINLEGYGDWKVFWILLAARIVPVVPTPLINVGAAVSKVKTSIYFFSSFIGKLFWAVVYVFLGDYFIRTHNLINAVAYLTAILILMAAAGKYYHKLTPFKKLKRAEKDENQPEEDDRDF